MAVKFFGQYLCPSHSIVGHILVVYIDVYRSAGTVAGNERVSTPPFILKTVYMDPPDCVNASLLIPEPTVNCYFVRANVTLVNPGLLWHSLEVAARTTYPANLELFVVSFRRTKRVIDVGAFGQGETPLRINLTDSPLEFKIIPGITIEILYEVPLFWKLGGGSHVNYGFQLEFPVNLNATVTVPGFGTVILPRNAENATAYTSPRPGCKHHLVSTVATQGSAGSVSAEVRIFVGIVSISIYHWHFYSEMSFVINGSREGFSFTYANKLPLFDKRL
ncbi:hypothetical protein FOZ60_002318 [Perkinsus olseni]|uniref:Uncharacterized protein n=1 Tax=Perkinsus olseni TaxID=32597 RepID=A0A7J6PIY4_PEROL|nr:hypothetical protein FOZ60_002318 [Perkinsus olseni]